MYVPRTFTLNMRSTALTGSLAVGALLIADALFTRMSMPPKCATAFSTAAFTFSASAERGAAQ